MYYGIFVERSRKAVIMAGGQGTRLRPVTFAMNKHLVPILDRPMIMYPLETLKSIGAKDIALVTGKEHVNDFVRFLGNGSEQAVRFTYFTQEGPRGMADAIMQSESFFQSDKVIAIAGDVIFDKVEVPKEALDDEYAYIFLKPYDNPKGVGVPVFDKNGNLTGIEEKPAAPKSNFVVTGLYIYPNDVFDFIRTQKPSARGELEITDVNNWYLKQKRLKAVKMSGSWTDAGTFESLAKLTLARARELGIKV